MKSPIKLTFFLVFLTLPLSFTYSHHHNSRKYARHHPEYQGYSATPSAPLPNNIPPSKVYFIPSITAEALDKVYASIGKTLQDKVGVKISLPRSPLFPPINSALITPLIQKLKADIIENCEVYNGERATESQMLTYLNSCNYDKIAPCVILDSAGYNTLPCHNSCKLDKTFIGDKLTNYRSFLIITNVTPYNKALFYGALMNTGYGLASVQGKYYIHSGGESANKYKPCGDNKFCRASLETALTIARSFLNEKEVVYINIIDNKTFSCSCSKKEGGICPHDIGILGSTDPLALDKASYDLILEHNKETSFNALREKKEDKDFFYLAQSYGLGSPNYDLQRLE